MVNFFYKIEVLNICFLVNFNEWEDVKSRISFAKDYIVTHERF